MISARLHFQFALIAALLACSAIPLRAAEKKESATPRDTRTAEVIEAATRLQIFLDRANFGPGKLDGYYGDFTRKALALYREAHGQRANVAPASADAPPDVRGIDLAAVDPVFVPYIVTEADLQNVGELPDSVAAKAKLKTLPYRDVAEAIAEKFHSDRDFLEKLNPGRTKTIAVGDQLKVPNVEPFDVAAVKDLKPGSEIAPGATNDIADEESGGAKSSGESATAGGAPEPRVQVDTKTNMLRLYHGDRLVAAYPVTIGSGRTESPVGNWKVKGVAMMPNYRHDEKMLKEGERSDDFHMLAPGPNNPVGVVWIALNKKGIGLHGTDDPDSIGRAASHGCVRLANWDVVRLAMKLKGGVPVTIE